MKTRLTALAALLVLALSACGGDDDTKADPADAPPSASHTSATEADTEPDMTACDTMKAGALIDDGVLDAVENGCYDEATDTINFDTYVVGECTDGRQMLEHADVLFGFVGETWQTGDVNSPAYKAAETECGAE